VDTRTVELVARIIHHSLKLAKIVESEAAGRVLLAVSSPISSILSSPAGLREPQLELAKIVGSEAGGKVVGCFRHQSVRY
jgi:hypothetical protein